jgi:hypothetical protein
MLSLIFCLEFQRKQENLSLQPFAESRLKRGLSPVTRDQLLLALNDTVTLKTVPEPTPELTHAVVVPMKHGMRMCCPWRLHGELMTQCCNLRNYGLDWVWYNNKRRTLLLVLLSIRVLFTDVLRQLTGIYGFMVNFFAVYSIFGLTLGVIRTFLIDDWSSLIHTLCFHSCWRTATIAPRL